MGLAVAVFFFVVICLALLGFLILDSLSVIDVRPGREWAIILIGFFILAMVEFALFDYIFG